MCQARHSNGSWIRARNFLPGRLKRVSPAEKLIRHLLPHERRLQDLCPPSQTLKALKEDETSEFNGLTGIWRKDKQRSDSMDKAFQAVKLPWLYRKAVAFLNYLEIENSESSFKTTLKAGGIMDVVEQYPWSGEIVTHKRRDKRSGHHTGRVVHTDEGPQLQIEWSEPYGGKGTDTFSLTDSTLIQTSVMEFPDSSKNCTYRLAESKLECLEDDDCRTFFHRVHRKGD